MTSLVDRSTQDLAARPADVGKGDPTVPRCKLARLRPCAAAARRRTGQEPVRRGSAPVGADRSPVRRLQVLVAVVALLALVLLAAGSQSMLVDSLTALRELDARWLPVLLVTQLVSMAAPALNARRLLRLTGTRVGLRPMLEVTYASNAISVMLPLAGPEVATAYTYRRYVRLGADGPAGAWTLLVSGVAAATTFALLLGASAVAVGTPGSLIALAVALLGVVPGLALLSALRRPAVRAGVVRGARAVLSWTAGSRLDPGRDLTAPLRESLRRLAEHRLSGRDRAAVGAVAMLNWLADGACLAVAVVAVGAPVPAVGVLMTFVAATAAGSLRLTPGGLGVVEAALTAGLVAAGLDAPQALAAALLYRLVSFWLVVVTGALCLAADPARAVPSPAPPEPVAPHRPLLRPAPLGLSKPGLSKPGPSPLGLSPLATASRTVAPALSPARPLHAAERS